MRIIIISVIIVGSMKSFVLRSIVGFSGFGSCSMVVSFFFL